MKIIVAVLTLFLQGCIGDYCAPEQDNFFIEITAEPYPTEGTVTFDGETSALDCWETNGGFFSCEAMVPSDATITAATIVIEGEVIELDVSDISYEGGGECNRSGRQILSYPES